MELRSKYTIRTSDRRVFRRCLRKWDFQSSLRGNHESVGMEPNINFWFGSAIHFALEDFHGYNRFGDPRIALWAYYQAFSAEERPAASEYYYGLGMAMLSYYVSWYPRHNEASGFETVYFNEKHEVVSSSTEGALPGVEQSFYIPLNVWIILDTNSGEKLQIIYDELEGGFADIKDSELFGYTDAAGQVHANCLLLPIMYHGTMDRIVVDRYGRYWILDYKTAKKADTSKLDTDDQISAYLWAASKWFNVPFYGFIYLQLTKNVVQEPKRLKDGTLSVDKRQKTTHALLKKELALDYGSLRSAPNKYIEFLNHLASLEEAEGDAFIRWDFVKRSKEELLATENHIYGELKSMLSPDFYAYPTPTRDCIWDCPIRDLCLASDRGDTVAVAEFLSHFKERSHTEDGNIEPWKEKIPWPETLAQGLPLLEDILHMDQCMNIELEGLGENDNGFQFMYEEEC